jgi:hypothetical protein
MTIKSDEAQAMLKDIESVVAMVKQSGGYRVSAVVVFSLECGRYRSRPGRDWETASRDPLRKACRVTH